jgi:hypothetical protein
MLLIDLFLRSNCLHGGFLSTVVTFCTRCSNGLSHSVGKFNIINFILPVFIVVTNIGQTSVLQWLFLHDIRYCIYCEVIYWVKYTINYSLNEIRNFILISLHFTLYFPVLFVKKCLFIRINYYFRSQIFTLCYPSAPVLAHSVPLHHKLLSFTYTGWFRRNLHYFEKW